MTPLPFERLFSMAAFDALRSYRARIVVNPDLSSEEVIKIIRALDPDSKALDFTAALELHSIVQPNAPMDGPVDFYRTCVSSVLLSHAKDWARAVTLGRERLLDQLERDQHQCLRAADLLGIPPEDDVVLWWDNLSIQMRLGRDEARSLQSRRAEKLSLEFETKRLQALGLALLPKWIAIEDNTVGYDILSYEVAGESTKNRLIEVKSTIASPLKFFVTRNEWDRAMEFSGSYYFHVWNMASKPPQMFEITVDQVRAHIPVDGADGKWATAEIPVRAVIH